MLLHAVALALAAARPASALPASAQVGDWRVGVHPGPAFVVGEAHRDYKHSVSFQGTVEGPLPLPESERWARVGLEVGHSPRHLSRQIPDSALRVLEISPYLRAARWLDETEFALHLGLGYYRTWSRRALVGGAAYDTPTRNHPGVNVGAAVTQWYEDRYGVGLDLRYHHLFHADGDFQYLLPSLRLLVAF